MKLHPKVKQTIKNKWKSEKSQFITLLENFPSFTHELSCNCLSQMRDFLQKYGIKFPGLAINLPHSNSMHSSSHPSEIALQIGYHGNQCYMVGWHQMLITVAVMAKCIELNCIEAAMQSPQDILLCVDRGHAEDNQRGTMGWVGVKLSTLPIGIGNQN